MKFERMVAILGITLLASCGPKERCHMREFAYFRVGQIVYKVPRDLTPIFHSKADPYCEAQEQIVAISDRLVLERPSPKSTWSKNWPADVKEIAISPQLLPIWPIDQQLRQRDGQFNFVEGSFTESYLSKKKLVQGGAVLVQRMPSWQTMLAQFGGSHIEFDTYKNIDSPEAALPKIETVNRLISVLRNAPRHTPDQ